MKKILMWVGALALGVATLGALEYAYAQASALGRWEMNDSYSDGNGVEDTAGAPSPTFHGVAVGSPGRCSTQSAATPKGTGDCTYFSGSSKYITGDGELFNQTGTQYSGSYTLMAWVALTSAPSDDAAIVHVGRDPQGYEKCEENNSVYCTGVHLYVDEYKHIVFGNGRGGDLLPTQDDIHPTLGCGTTLALGTAPAMKWYFVVGVFDSNKAQYDPLTLPSTSLYVRAVDDTENDEFCSEGFIFIPKIAQDSTAGWSIGAFREYPDNQGVVGYHGHLNGYIDDVRVFDRALSLTEINTLFSTSGNGG